jgi:hypothetical protein
MQRRNFLRTLGAVVVAPFIPHEPISLGLSRYPTVFGSFSDDDLDIDSIENVVDYNYRYTWGDGGPTPLEFIRDDGTVIYYKSFLD